MHLLGSANYENLFYVQQHIIRGNHHHQVHQKASINSQIETDSSIHTAARSKDILEISTHLSFAKFGEELSEMRRDLPHPILQP
ncbi:hypothetical protein CDAR_365051 [Caerostris darwini]|uniref:Uncharacterized protein n=1 Tax=Caerostris darwini TaxID=1538125 RepID=A0AAV4S5J3_9ARAC|nr:hypothetical protein CDAR_365051 [Caerostris darwini]